MFAVSEGPDRGWGSLQIVGSMLLGAALLAWMVRVELRARQPLLKLRLYANKLFRSTSLVLMITMAAILGVLFAAPLFFQIALGLSPLQSGLSTFPEAIGVMIGAQIASRLLYPRIGPRRLVAAGLIGMACAMSLMSLIGVDTTLWWMRGPHVRHGDMHGPGHRLVTGGLVRNHLRRRHRRRLLAVQQPAAARQRVGVALVTTVIAAVGATHSVDGHTGRQPGRLSRRLSGRRRGGPDRIGARPHHQRCRRRGHHGAARGPPRPGASG